MLSFLKRDAQCQFINIVDVCGVDYPSRSKRFDVVYHLLSPRQNQRIRVKVSTDEDTPVPSVFGVSALGVVPVHAASERTRGKARARLVVRCMVRASYAAPSGAATVRTIGA